MRRLLAIAGILVGSSAALMAQGNNVSVYGIKDIAGVLPPTTVTTPQALPLSVPDAIFVDPKGNVYVTDTGGHKVWKIDASGKVTIVMGTGVFGGPGLTGVNATGGNGQLTTSGKAANTQSLGLPSGLTMDANGNLYIADRSQHRIFKVDTSGVATVYAGVTTNGRFDGDGRPALQADFNAPRGITFGPDGAMYVADSGNERIRRIDPNTTVVTTIAGSGASGSSTTTGFSGDGGLAVLARLNAPEDVAFDSFGNMYIADTGNNRIRMVAAGTGIITTIAGRDLTNLEKGLDANGNPIPVTGCTSSTCLSNSAAGKSNFYSAASAPYPNSCAVPSGTIKVGSPLPVTSNGGNTVCAPVGDGKDPLSALLASPSNIVVDASNNVYFTDRNNDRIRELISNAVQSGTNQSAGYGQIITVIGSGSGGNGGDGGLGKQATIGDKAVTGLAIDSTGKLYFTDRANSRARIFDPVSGLISSFAGASTFNGDGPCLSSGAVIGTLFNNPTGIAQDAAGNTYVADTGNNIIRKISASAGGTCVVTTIAGIVPRNSTGTNAGNASGEGIDALTATLNQPTGIAVDPSGTQIYFADIGSNRIRKISNGLITTIGGCAFTQLTPSSSLAQNCALTSDGLPGPITKLNLSGGTTQNTKKFTGVALDSKGVVYFAESGSNVVRKIQLDGTLVTIAGQFGVAGSGGDGGPAVNLVLSNPTGVAVDSSFNVFIADTANFAAHMITGNSGLALPVAGEVGSQSNDNETSNNVNSVAVPAWAKRYRALQGVAVDTNGNVYISDTTDNKIDRIPYAAPAACFAATGCPANSSPGVDYRVAGNEGNTNPEFTFDYSAPASATALASTVQVSFPTSLVVDSQGNVLFTDTANNLIREATAPSSK